MDLYMKNNSLFISLEGIDGCGKSSLIEKLITRLVQHSVLCIREPGGTVISEKIRDMLLDIKNKGIIPRTEALLYMAARSQLVEEIINPGLAAGKIVLADRYIDSTVAYQGYGRGLEINLLKTLNQFCTGGIKPHLTLLLDITPEEGERRRRTDIPDRLEKEGITFQEKVREGYLQLAREEPDRIKIIDAAKEIEAVADEAMHYIQPLLDKKDPS